MRTAPSPSRARWLLLGALATLPTRSLAAEPSPSPASPAAPRAPDARPQDGTPADGRAPDGRAPDGRAPEGTPPAERVPSPRAGGAAAAPSLLRPALPASLLPRALPASAQGPAGPEVPSAVEGRWPQQCAMSAMSDYLTGRASRADAWRCRTPDVRFCPTAQAAQEKLQACMAGLLARRPDFEAGEVALRLQLEGGAVRGVCLLEDALKDRQALECAARVAAGLSLPSGSTLREQTWVIPFVKARTQRMGAAF